MGSRLKRRKAPENTAQMVRAEDRCALVLLCVVLVFERESVALLVFKVDVKDNFTCFLKLKHLQVREIPYTDNFYN
jgi:hypothetical protein